MIKGLHNKCLVLDNTYMPKDIIDTGRGYAVFYKGNAEIVNNHDELFGLVDKTKEIYKPSVIRVNKYINKNFHRVPLNRDNIFRRDDHKCVYCGYDDVRALTIDHVIPKSRGGEDSWENWVTACRGCNLEKDNLTAEEWGRTHPNPKRPHLLMLLKKLNYIPDEWRTYLLLGEK